MTKQEYKNYVKKLLEELECCAPADVPSIQLQFDIAKELYELDNWEEPQCPNQ